MRSLKFVACLLLLSVGACGKQSSPGTAPAAGTAGTEPAAPATPAATGPAVTGMVLFDEPTALGPGATLTVRLLDITRADGEPMLITTQTFPVAAVPAEFTLPYDRAKIDSIRTYAVDATVMDQGAARFVSMGRVGVLTQGRPTRANIMLAQGMTSVERDPVKELNTEFADFESRLGGLKRITGSRILEKEEISIAWDAFVDQSGVRMVRETVNHPDGSRIEGRYGFKDGQPWVLVREAGGTTTRLGWNSTDTLLIHERNGETAEIAEDEIKRIREAANDAKEVAAAQAG